MGLIVSEIPTSISEKDMFVCGFYSDDKPTYKYSVLYLLSSITSDYNHVCVVLRMYGDRRNYYLIYWKNPQSKFWSFIKKTVSSRVAVKTQLTVIKNLSEGYKTITTCKDMK